MTTIPLERTITESRKEGADWPSGWWLLPSVVVGAIVWVKLGIMVFS